MVELLEAIQNKDFFKRPTPMRPGTPQDPTRYCAFHRDNDHDIENCRYLRNLMEELIKAGKLKEFVLADLGRRLGKESTELRSNEPVQTR